ncbi:hypothetical protein FHX42_003545 [Saccharopolyspora lacisalsi]|uniref:Uncharacterized protein n=1 Tax=Halosaccharopolyspora lacisalsi TaxID=1000566 RepID=A0A839DZQ2_9PSEU|nr:hypothetical protein [Halosaccharopolyspora lacisalsi]MBA8826169.1 hypothetical protein [Halosaccharopolyspora lacisalsi]
MHKSVTVWRRALVAEVCWIDGDGRPASIPATPLLLDDVPCLALPYAWRDRVAALRDSPEVAFAVTDARSLPEETTGTAVFGTAGVVEDLDGSVFADELLEQELVKYPPSRVLADSVLLRRENWWWLPRLIVRLDGMTRTAELTPRTDPSRQALLVRDDLGLRIDSVTVEQREEQRPLLRTLDGENPRGDTGPALVLGHDHTTDFERWEPWSLSGHLRGEELLVEQSSGRPGAPLPSLRLLERIRRQRALEKACRRGITEAERVRGVPGSAR